MNVPWDVSVSGLSTSTRVFDWRVIRDSNFPPTTQQSKTLTYTPLKFQRTFIPSAYVFTTNYVGRSAVKFLTQTLGNIKDHKKRRQ